MRTFAATALLLAMVLVGHAPVAAAEASPQPAASDAPVVVPEVNPICEQAFVVVELAMAEAGASDAASPAPGATVVASPDAGGGLVERLDGAVRACASLIDWTVAALQHPDALAGEDALQFLQARCTDPEAGLDAYATCRSLAVAIATPTPEAVATPTPTPTPAPTPRPTPKPAAGSTTSKVGADGLVRLPRKLTAKVPGATTIRYFNIAGQSAGALVRQTLKRAKRPCGIHNALACVNMSWRVQTSQTGATGSCTISDVGWTLTSTVHLPRWTKPARVDPALLRWWRQVLKVSARHEARHIAIQRKILSTMRGQLVGRPCTAFQNVLNRIEKRSKRQQAAFDRDERANPLPRAP